MVLHVIARLVLQAVIANNLLMFVLVNHVLMEEHAP